MKRFIVILTAFFILVGCQTKDKDADSTPTDGVNEELLEYVMPKENTAYLFDGEGAYSEWYYFYDYISDNFVQRKIQVGDLAVGELLQFSEDEMRLVSGIAPYFFIHDMRNDEFYQDLLLLKGPFTEGNSWVKEDSSLRKSTSTITAVDKEIELPIGKKKAMEVTTETLDIESDTVVTSKEYYVKGIGFVRFEETGSSRGERVVALSEILENQQVVQNIAFFYPGNEELLYEEKEISTGTNTNMEMLLSEGFKSFEGEYPPIFTKDDHILHIIFDMFENKVVVDINKNFLDTQMKRDNEEEFLEALVHTLAVYHGVPAVEITIEGEPYQSNKIKMTKGEVFEVDERLLSSTEE